VDAQSIVYLPANSEATARALREVEQGLSSLEALAQTALPGHRASVSTLTGSEEG
jgi:hypothetical protein